MTSKKALAGNRRVMSGAPEAHAGLPLRGVLPGLLRWTLAGVGLILLAGCGTTRHEEPPPTAAVQAQITPVSTDTPAVKATPFNEMVNDTKQFLETKRGKQVLIGAGGLFVLIISMVIISRIVRGSPAARLRAQGRDEFSRSPSPDELDPLASVLDPSERSHR